MSDEQLLLAAAAVARTAGTGAIAQQENRAAPTERSGPSTTSKPNSGALQQNRNEPGGRVGQSGRQETSGEAPQDRSTEEQSKASSQDRSRVGNKAAGEENKANKKERGAPRANNVNFALTIGTPVPRSVKLVRLPSTIVEIEPAWRDFEYFVVGGEIVIVDPRKMEIVAVVPA